MQPHTDRTLFGEAEAEPSATIPLVRSEATGAEAPGSAAMPPKEAARRPARKRANHPLPPIRMTVAKQLEVLRAHVIAHQQNRRPVSTVDLSRIVGLHVNNVCLPNPFFAELGLIIKHGFAYIPSADAVAYARACEWGTEGAASKLAPVLAASWFGTAVVSMVQIRPRDEIDVVAALAEQSGAPFDAKPSLHMLIDYLELAGLVVRDGGAVRLAPPPGAPEPEPEAAAVPHEVTAATVERPAAPVPTPEPVRAEPPPAAAGFSGVDFAADEQTVKICVDRATMKEWNADQIAALFNGLAQVITAKGGSKQQV